MTDVPNSTPDDLTPAGDPELAALVRQDAPPDAADPSLAAVAADPELAALVRSDVPWDDAGSVFDTAPFLPLAADFETATPPRRRRSLAIRFGVAFVLGFLLTVGI